MTRGVAGRGASPCPPPPRGPYAHGLPLQMMVFSTNGREASLSLSLSPPPATIVISCQKFLDGRGNVQVLMR